MMTCFMILLMVAGGPEQCPRDISSISRQLAANGLGALSSLHDYVSVMDLHEILRDRKGKITTRDYRQQTIVAQGQMYVRDLRPGEEPAMPEPAGPLSSEYRVSPAPGSQCKFMPCDANPGEFLQVDTFPAVWDVLAVRETKLNGAPVLVMELHAKRATHPAYRDAGTAWVDAEHCRLLRLTTLSLDRGKTRTEETTDFGEVKGSWLPVKRRIHSFLKGKIAEYTEEYTYTYLKFGATVTMQP